MAPREWAGVHLSRLGEANESGVCQVYEKCMKNEKKVYKKDKVNKVNKVFGIGEIGSAVKSSRAGRSLPLLLLPMIITWDFAFYASSVTLKQIRS